MRIAFNIGKNYRVSTNILDREGWQEWREFGCSLRIYLHRKKPRMSWWVSLPGSNRRFRKMWENATPVEIIDGRIKVPNEDGGMSEVQARWQHK